MMKQRLKEAAQLQQQQQEQQQQQQQQQQTLAGGAPTVPMLLFPDFPFVGQNIADHLDVNWQHPVGRGSFGVVYHATIKPVYNARGEQIHPQVGWPVAVKKMSKELMKAELKKLVNEVRVLHRVSMPSPATGSGQDSPSGGRRCNYIVLFYNIFEDETDVYLIMEWMNGGDIRSRMLESCPSGFAEPYVQVMMRRMCEALAWLHREQIIHRDIKPENILCGSRGNYFEVKLADFGFATTLLTENHLAQTACGSPYYVAPEVLRSGRSSSSTEGAEVRKGYTCAVDMWSLGVVAYYLLSGTRPFDREDQGELFREICLGHYSFPASNPTWGRVSTDAVDFIRRLLVINPADRMTAAQALKHPWLEKANPDPLGRFGGAAAATSSPTQASAPGTAPA